MNGLPHYSVGMSSHQAWQSNNISYGFSTLLREWKGDHEQRKYAKKLVQQKPIPGKK